VVALAVLKPAPHTEDAEEGAADFGGRQRFAQETFARACEAMPCAQRGHARAPGTGRRRTSPARGRSPGDPPLAVMGLRTSLKPYGSPA
jgi:hypothetical protein